MKVQSRLELIVAVHWLMGEPLVNEPCWFSTRPLASFCTWKMPAKLFVVVVELTVRLTLVLCVKLPLAPVTCTVEVPAAVPVVVATVSVEEPIELTEAGLKLAVAPLGRPPALNVT